MGDKERSDGVGIFVAKMGGQCCSEVVCYMEVRPGL